MHMNGGVPTVWRGAAVGILGADFDGMFIDVAMGKLRVDGMRVANMALSIVRRKELEGSSFGKVPSLGNEFVPFVCCR